jgi:hypothetical protein
MLIELFEGPTAACRLGVYQCDYPLKPGVTVGAGQATYVITKVQPEPPGKMIAICRSSTASPDSPGVIPLTVYDDQS